MISATAIFVTDIGVFESAQVKAQSRSLCQFSSICGLETVLW